jgi:hypothetical protein
MEIKGQQGRRYLEISHGIIEFCDIVNEPERLSKKLF